MVVGARARSLRCRPVKPAVKVPDSTRDARSRVRISQRLRQFAQSRFGGAQAGSSRLCSAMRNLTFLLGFSDGTGLKRSFRAYFAGVTSIVK